MITQGEYRRLKTRLSRALNAAARDRGNPVLWRKLRDEASYGLSVFEDVGYPDAWHRWEVAERDARFQLQLLEV
jgi:hypothetical protein